MPTSSERNSLLVSIAKASDVDSIENIDSLVRQAADVFGFAMCSESDFTSNLIWNDTLISMDIVSSLKPYQKVNHFPTMSEISRKDLLARNFEK